MDRVGFTMKIKPECREEYLEIHHEVDRALIEEYRALGVRNYAIYLAEDGTLFAFLECDDFAAYKRAVEGSPNQKAWGEKVYHLFEVKPDQPGGLVPLALAVQMGVEHP